MTKSWFLLVGDIKWWLLGIGSGLIAIHLTCIEKTGHDDLLLTSIIFWLAVCSLIWERRDRLKLESGPLSTILGSLILGIVLTKSLSLSTFDFFLRLFPLFSLLGLGLLASGLPGLKYYWKEGLILSFLIPHGGFLSQVLDTSKITAQFSTALLWYLGFDVTRQGVNIVLPNGTVEVNPGCSGYGSIVQLLGLAVIFLMMFSVRRIYQIGLPIAAVLIGFGINSIRVAIMAWLVSLSNQEGFDFWHSGDGSLIFSLISVCLFGVLCMVILQQTSHSVSDSQSEP